MRSPPAPAPPAPAPDGLSAEALSPRNVRAILLGLMLAQMLAALDTTIVGPAMSTIGRDLGDYEHLPWIVTAYLLVSTTLTPLYGKLSDIHGRRIMLLIAIGSFVIGSVACALARSMIFLVFARGFQGVGGAGITAMTMTIMGDIVAPRERPKYQVYVSVVWILANLAGPVLGGYIAGWLHWSLIFWINAPLGLAAWIVTSGRLKSMPRHERPHRLDFIGAILLMIASALAMLGLSWGGQRYSWASTPILGLFAASGFSWALLVWRQLAVEEPLIPLSVVSNRIVLAGALATGFMMASYLGMAIYAPIYFQTVAGLSVAAAGAATLPLMLGTTLTAALSVRVMNRIDRYWNLPRAGLALSAASSVALSFSTSAWPLMAMELLMTLVSLGLGPIFPVINVSVQAAVPPHELGTSMSLLTFLRNIGAALGVAVFGTIVIGGVATGLTLVRSSAAIGSNPIAASATFHTVFLVAAVGFGIAFACLAGVREPSLKVKHVTKPVAASD